MAAPECTTGNEPEYSRADLHELDAVMCGGADKAAARPALCDLIAFAGGQREALKTSLTVLCAARNSVAWAAPTLKDFDLAIAGCRTALGIHSLKDEGKD